MSFSSEVKEELAKQFGRSRHCQIAELAGILELEGMLDEEGKLVVSNENSLLQTKYGLLLQKIFGEKQEVLHADTALGSGTVPVPENKSPESGWDAGAADML
jgi:DNA-binding transcriptional regulator WhiA